MPELIECLKDKRIIKITSYGEITEIDLQKSREQVINICSEHGYTKILVDATNLSEKLPIIPAFNHGLSLAKNFTLRKARHAFVVNKENSKVIDFIVTVAINRGANTKLFYSIDEAERWLFE